MNIQHTLKNKDPWIILLIGVPCSGKSTAIKEWFPNPEENNISIISRDDILMEVSHETDYGKAFKKVDQKEVNKLLKSRIVESSIMKENVIIDMTNLSSKRRKDTLNSFSDEYYKVAIIFPFLSNEEYEKRNEKRSKGPENKFISKDVMNIMRNSYQKIQDDEEFDKIISL